MERNYLCILLILFLLLLQVTQPRKISKVEDSTLHCWDDYLCSDGVIKELKSY